MMQAWSWRWTRLSAPFQLIAIRRTAFSWGRVPPSAPASPRQRGASWNGRGEYLRLPIPDWKGKWGTCSSLRYSDEFRHGSTDWGDFRNRGHQRNTVFIASVVIHWRKIGE